MTRFVGSESFPSLLPTTRYTRPRLPSDGSLGPHFPIFWVTNGDTVLCSATTATCPSRWPSLVARPPIPCLSPMFVSFLQARWRSGTLAPTPGLLGLPVRLFRLSDKETTGSPKFPGYPFELMPCSSTPVVSSVLALSHSGLLPSATMNTSAFPPKSTVIIHDYTNFGAQLHGLFSCSRWLRTPVTGLTRSVRYRPVG